MILRRLGILACVILLMLSAAAVSGESVADYNRLLQDISQRLDQAQRMEEAKPGSGVPVIKQLWNDCPASVCVPSGRGKGVDAELGWVCDALYDLQHGSDADRAERISLLRERMGTLSAASQPQAGMGTTEVKQAKSTLRQVLAANEYKPTFWDKLMLKVQEAIYGLLSRVNVSSNAADVIGKVIMAIAVIVFVVAVIYLVMHFVKLYSGKPVDKGRVQRAQVRRTRKLTPEVVLEAAERDASAGRYREAFRGVYLASILLLDRAKLLKHSDGVTNWEYLRALKRGQAPEPTSVFGEMTTLFDQCVYGSGKTSSADYKRNLEHYRRLEGLL